MTLMIEGADTEFTAPDKPTTLYVLFENPHIAVLSDGIVVTCRHYDPGVVFQRHASNEPDVAQAKRAKELGVDVPDIQPVWEPIPDVPRMGTPDELRRAIELAMSRQVFLLHSQYGRLIQHDPSAPKSSVRITEMNDYRPGWEIILEGWAKEFDRQGRAVYTALSDDLKYKGEVSVSGWQILTGNMPESELINYGVPVYIRNQLAYLRDLRERRKLEEERLDAQRKANDLRKKYGG